MGDILVVMPPEWNEESFDTISSLTGDGMTAIQSFADSKHFSDLNAKLECAGYFKDTARIVDIQIINNQLFFKFGEV